MFFSGKRLAVLILSAAMLSAGSIPAAAVTVTEAEGQTAVQGSPTVYYGGQTQGTEAWSEYVRDGETSSNPKEQAMQSIRAGIEHVSGSIEYRVYLNQGGWQPWTSDNQPTSIPEGETVQVEAVQMRLTGEISNFLDIYYRTEISQDGQLDWAKNGQKAGSMGEGQYICNFQVRLIAKTDPAPGPVEHTLSAPYADGLQYVDGRLRYLDPDGTAYTGWTQADGSRYYINDSYAVTGWQYLDGYKLYFAEDGKLLQDLEPVIGAQSSYLIKINKQMNCLTVYAKDGNNGYIIPVRSMLCSTGNDTPIGTWRTTDKYRWHLMQGDVYTQYATRIIPGTGYMLHSVIYRKPNNRTLKTSTYNQLGVARSAGCIRLTTADSKWIYDNCKSGTTVTIYNAPSAGPYDRPSVTPIPGNQTWDPTDIYVK